jgi:thymidylate synthase
MERLWPKFARRTPDGKLPFGTSTGRKYPDGDKRPKFGIAHGYGDLEDLVELLANEPYTRQAWIPLFFPEDTGKSDGGRKVCTLGYQIIVRNGTAHIWYPLRSCDFIRHFRDDCYLAVRLLLWIMEQCRRLNPDAWNDIIPGTFSFHATSLHIFESDVGNF